MTTLQRTTSLMRTYERIINWYNKKYSFDMSKATAKEQKKYNSAMNIWDQLKIKRDQLKSAA